MKRFSGIEYDHRGWQEDNSDDFVYEAEPSERHEGPWIGADLECSAWGGRMPHPHPRTNDGIVNGKP